MIQSSVLLSVSLESPEFWWYSWVTAGTAHTDTRRQQRSVERTWYTGHHSHWGATSERVELRIKMYFVGKCFHSLNFASILGILGPSCLERHDNSMFLCLPSLLASLQSELKLLIFTTFWLLPQTFNYFLRLSIFSCKYILSHQTVQLQFSSLLCCVYQFPYQLSR